MSELLERYVHQVGRHLPAEERADIEAELRSQLQDQLEDRYGPAPTEDEVAAVLAELGHPRQMATSYRSDQYLVGPDFYPYMMMVLRPGWMLVPLIVTFLNMFSVLVSSEAVTVLSLLIEPLVAAVQATFVFSGLVILFFALAERTGVDMREAETPFDPAADLPNVNDPGNVERYEPALAIAMGTFGILVFLYFLQVGGLTLRFNLNDPGDVIPIPTGWTILLLLLVAGQVAMHVLVLWRKRWSVGTWLTETVLEVFGVIPSYFVLYVPIAERIIRDNPDLADSWFLNNGPEIFAVLYASLTLLGRSVTLVRLWNYEQSRGSVFFPVFSDAPKNKS
jgi:hypothetical protein